MRTVRIATRGSLLAMAQAEAVKREIEALGYPAQIVKVETKGDRDREHALTQIGGDGLFVRGIEKELLAGAADVAVHCGKDLPYRIADGLTLAGVPRAADSRDELLWPEGRPLEELRVIGTGSPRRESELKKLLPKAVCAQIRGNIHTRVEKLRAGQYDGIILAKAGLDRLGVDLAGLSVRVFEPEEMVPAACQGILALECRSGDEEAAELLGRLSDAHSARRFEAERALFCRMQADCTLPLGVHSRVEEDTLTLWAMYDGKKGSVSGSWEERQTLIEGLAAWLVETKAVGSVTLVGAGCGAGLITVKGLEALRQAQAVVYDDLIDDSLLEALPADCERIYVGKRYGAHSRTQEEINGILVDCARRGKRVVRLKGGDSFVFGRGGEEYLALAAEGIPCSLIPGVSSSIAVPECAGIPVTHRGVARSFTVITGHTADGTGENYEALAKLSGTLVFLMGKHAYPRITRELIEKGRAPETPASVISRGCSPREERIDGTLADIAERAQEAPTPAILVVGEVAAFHMKDAAGILDEERESRPLAGCRVTVTGTEGFTEKLAEKLAEQGAGVRRIPTLELLPCSQAVPENLSEWQWLAFTSANGIRIFFDVLRERRTDLRKLAGLRFACIGQGTADKLMEQGFEADLMARPFTAEALGQALGQTVKAGERVLILRAANGSPLLTERLDEAGVLYEDRKIYDTRERVPEAAEGEEPEDYLVFASAAGARAWFARRQVSPETVLVCIGVFTARAVPETFGGTVLVAEDFTAEGIIEAISRHRGGKERTDS